MLCLNKIYANERELWMRISFGFRKFAVLVDVVIMPGAHAVSAKYQTTPTIIIELTALDASISPFPNKNESPRD